MHIGKPLKSSTITKEKKTLLNEMYRETKLITAKCIKLHHKYNINDDVAGEYIGLLNGHMQSIRALKANKFDNYADVAINQFSNHLELMYKIMSHLLHI